MCTQANSMLYCQHGGIISLMAQTPKPPLKDQGFLMCLLKSMENDLPAEFMLDRG